MPSLEGGGPSLEGSFDPFPMPLYFIWLERIFKGVSSEFVEDA
jgi:hypothetical protein